MTIAELADVYMLRLQAENRSPNTLRSYEGELRQFARWIGPNKKLEDIDRFAIRRYFMAFPGARSTMRHRREILKGAMEEGIILGKISRNVVEAVYTPRFERRLPYCPPEAELLRALENDYLPEFSAWPARDKALLELAYSTMARIDELHGMGVEHVDWPLRAIRVTGKGDKQRLVLFGEAAEMALRAYLRERGTRPGALFLNRSRRQSGERMSTRRLHSTIKAVLMGLGMPKAIHPHSLRRAGATHMLNRGADLRIIKALLGHEKLSTTAVYARLAPERLRSVFQSTHPDNRAAS